MLMEKRSDGTEQTAVLNDWDRAKRVGSKSTGYNPRTVGVPYAEFGFKLIFGLHIYRAHGNSHPLS